MRDLCNNIAGIVLQKTQQTREMHESEESSATCNNGMCDVDWKTT